MLTANICWIGFSTFPIKENAKKSRSVGGLTVKTDGEDTMELLADPITINCRKAIAGMKMIGVDYSLTKIDYFQGEQKSPEFVAINPMAANIQLETETF